MNNLVSDAKTKCFWDPEIMEACKKWDGTLRNNPICVPPDSVQEPETAPSDVHQEDKTNEECRENEEAQRIISNVVDTVKQMESEGKHLI
ncbi:hypothetical protein Hanom_Chr15g01379091 [Helianthus anomalus]